MTEDNACASFQERDDSSVRNRRNQSRLTFLLTNLGIDIEHDVCWELNPDRQKGVIVQDDGTSICIYRDTKDDKRHFIYIKFFSRGILRVQQVLAAARNSPFIVGVPTNPSTDDAKIVTEEYVACVESEYYASRNAINRMYNCST